MRSCRAASTAWSCAPTTPPATRKRPARGRNIVSFALVPTRKAKCRDLARPRWERRTGLRLARSQNGPSVLEIVPRPRPRHHRPPMEQSASRTRTALARFGASTTCATRAASAVQRHAVAHGELDGVAALDHAVVASRLRRREADPEHGVGMAVLRGDARVHARLSDSRRGTEQPQRGHGRDGSLHAPIRRPLPARRSSSARTKPSRSPSSTRWASPIS